MSVAATAQEEFTLRGNVKTQAGEPVIGATVSVGGKAAAVTDADGNFTAKAARGNTLTVSYVGYVTQAVVANSAAPLSIVLQEEYSSLDEIVVVGTIMKKSDLTGAVGSVDGRQLVEKPVTNVNQALQGRMAGVFISPANRPSDDTGIRIRGINSINSGTEPIYVVDGMVMNNDYGGFSALNPNDIEHLEVLKDASATALYGSRGANGVVLITTKKGYSREGTVSYDGWLSVSKMVQQPELMDGTGLAGLRISSFANGYLRDHPGADIQEYISKTLLGTNLAFSAQELESYNSSDNTWKSFDWLDQVVRTGVEHVHNISFSKAFDQGSVYLSFNYAGKEGILKGSRQDKYSGRINAEAHIKPWLKVGTNTSFTRTEDGIPSDDVYNKALSANPLLDYAPYMNPETRYTKPYLTVYYQALSESYNNEYNPFNSQEVQIDRARSRIASSNFLNIEFMKGLNFRSTLSFDHVSQSWFRYIPSYIQESIRHESGDAQATHQRWEQTNWQWDNTLSWDSRFGVHHVNAMIGTSATKYISNFDSATGMRFPSDDLGYHELAGAAAFEKTVIDSDFGNSSLMSYIIRGNYDYANRYFLTVTARYDGSSKFAKGHRWGLFPSFSAAWEVTNEDFMNSQSVFSRLKFRLGYGVVGNQDIQNYVYETWYTPVTSRVTVNNSTVGQAGYANSGLRGTPGITWEKQRQFNAGVDMGFFSNRLTASLDLFFITNKDLLMQHSLHQTTGYSTTWENIGTVKNRGFEASVSANIIRTADWGWNFGANISFDKNEVTELYGDVDKILNGTDRQNNIFLNEALHTIYTYRSGGIANEDNRSEWEGINYNGRTVEPGDIFIKDISGPDGKPDGVINQYDREVVGRSDPTCYGGFNTDLRWKNFTLNAIMTYSLGAKKISGYYETLTSSRGLSPASPDLADRWSETNRGAKFPRAIYNSSGYNGYYPYETDMTIQKADYLRLSTLTLAYQFDKRLVAPLRLNSLRLYVTGSNLFCLTGYKGFDPETGDYNYPPTRTFTFGMNLSF